MNDLVISTPLAFPTRVWRMTVIDAFDIAPALRRVRLVEEDGFAHRAGQNLVLNLARRTQGWVRRAVAIQAFDPDEQVIDVDVPLTGDDPGFAWASAAKLGDELTGEVAPF